MNKSGFLALGASIFLALSLVLPADSSLAANSGAKKTTHTVQAKKTARAAKAKKTASAKKKESVKRTASTKKESAKKSVAKADKTEVNAERDLWLKRAQASDALKGKASWYGKDFHNKATASGLAYDMHTFTAAHRTLPIGTVVKVTDQNNGKSVMVCVTDRGPYVKGRVIDVSYAAAKQLGLNEKGVGRVELEVVSDEHGAPIKKDQAFFVKYSSANGKNKVGPFHAFADAAAMREALSQAHPKAEVIVEKEHRP